MSSCLAVVPVDAVVLADDVDAVVHSLLHNLLVLGEGLLQQHMAARLSSDCVQKKFSFCQEYPEPVVQCLLLVRILESLENLKQIDRINRWFMPRAPSPQAATQNYSDQLFPGIYWSPSISFIENVHKGLLWLRSLCKPRDRHKVRHELISERLAVKFMSCRCKMFTFFIFSNCSGSGRKVL